VFVGDEKPLLKIQKEMFTYKIGSVADFSFKRVK